MQLLALVRFAFTTALAISIVPYSEAAGVSLRSITKSSWLPTDYQLTPCGHHCAPGDFAKGEEWGLPKREEKVPVPCRCDPKPQAKPLLSKSGCIDAPPNPCGFPDKTRLGGCESSSTGCACDQPVVQKTVTTTAPPTVLPCTIRPGAVVRLVDNRETLIHDFETFMPPPPSPQASPAPAAPVNFHAVSGSAMAPAPAVATAPAPSPYAQVMTCRYVPGMDKMLGKDFVVKDMKNGCVGLPSPDGSQDGVWYFPATSLILWEHTSDGQAPNVGKLARKFLGDPEYADLDIVPPGRHEAPWDYRIQGWSLTKPVAPHIQEYVDFKKTAVRLPPWNKVRQIASVDCMDKMHHDPHYVCPPGSYASNAAQTYIHSKLRPSAKKSSVVPGMNYADRSMNKAVKSQETASESTDNSKKDDNKKMDTESYFRSSERTLNGAQGNAEQQGL